MGYTTSFSGGVAIEPPLNDAERAYLTSFAETRRVQREKGPYYVGDLGAGRLGLGTAPQDDITDNNRPPEGQPGLWCQWVPLEDGSELVWDEGEKFYESAEWMAYLIEHFLKPGAVASTSGEPQFAEFSFDHVCNGTIEAQGEDSDDHWLLVVERNEVRVVPGQVVFGEQIDLEPLLRACQEAAEGDSIDAELEALRAALDAALKMLGFDWPEAVASTQTAQREEE